MPLPGLAQQSAHLPVPRTLACTPTRPSRINPSAAAAAAIAFRALQAAPQTLLFVAPLGRYMRRRSPSLSLLPKPIPTPYCNAFVYPSPLDRPYVHRVSPVAAVRDPVSRRRFPSLHALFHPAVRPPTPESVASRIAELAEPLLSSLVLNTPRPALKAAPTCPRTFPNSVRRITSVLPAHSAPWICVHTTPP